MHTAERGLILGKYIDDTLAHRALDAAAYALAPGSPQVPFLWSGTQWVTLTGEWRDLPKVRSGVGEWLADFAFWLRRENYDAMQLAEDRAELDRQARSAEMDVRLVAAEVRTLVERSAAALRRQAEAIIVPPMTVPLELIKGMESAASEILTATDARATHLLRLASQFDAFRAPMRDPADWVAGLSAAPRTEHVRTSAVWDAFSLAEPALARSLGARTGKSVLFAAMDKRFGARRKLSGYEGWRGVALTA